MPLENKNTKINLSSTFSKRLVVLTGPTAVGKTSLSIKLAEKLNTEIVSCDSRQFYREMTIGTAKPSLVELQRVPHHFIGHKSIHTNYSVGDYEKEALAKLEKLYQKYDDIILTGGSGLFIKAITEGLDSFPNVDPSIVEQLNEVYQKDGLEPIQKMLLEYDPEYFQAVDLQNHRRIIRAVSICIASDKPYSSFLQNESSKRNFTTRTFILNRDREVLYNRINRRVDLMIEKGLITEVKGLYQYKNLKSSHTVGYTELFNYLDGGMTLEKAIEKIKQHSRNYAKRQLTWFRGMKNTTWIDLDIESQPVDFILQKLQNENLESGSND